jgi:hypothetical protein
MFRKLAPLIILAMFVIATFFVIRGLEHATAISHPTMKNR